MAKFDKTQAYSSSEDLNKTQVYSDRTYKTKAYGTTSEIAGKTVGYDSQESARINKTDAHGLGIGDKILLNEKKYKITEIISGDNVTGEAVIYRIQDDQEKDFALKLYYKFSNPRDEPNPEALRRIKEANDPDILRLHDYGTGDNKYKNKYCFEICDFAKGSDLLSVPNIEEKYTIDFLRSNIIPEIFKGIRTLHNYKICHCDLKPQNIFFLDENQTDLIIGDYGSAKTFEESSEKQSRRTSTFKGTDFYLAPEQARGIVSEKNDYHSFGMILLHLLYPELVNRQTLDRIIERQFARKPIIDFNPEFGRINDLIAGLTLVTASSRWGENEVKTWIRGEDVKVKYSITIEAYVQTINLGKTVIRTVEDIINYIENDSDWFENLIGDIEGYNLLLRWISDLQGVEQKKVFDKMVRTYQQNGKDYVYQAILRYFEPQRPVQVDMKTYDFWGAENVAELTKSFMKHIDDIWKITELEKIKFCVFQLEFVLRQIETQDESLQTIIGSILDKISSAVECSRNQDFDDFLCKLYSEVSNEKLINLFYLFDEKRTFKDLKNKTYNTLKDIGFLFAKGKNLFDNHYLTIEKNRFLEKEHLSNLRNVAYKDFLFAIFNKEIKSELEILGLTFEKPTEGKLTIKYQFGKSLSDYFMKNDINTDIVSISTEEEIILNRGAVPLATKISYEFLHLIDSRHKIDKKAISDIAIRKVTDKIKQETSAYHKQSFKLFNYSFWPLFFYVLMFCLLSLNVLSLLNKAPLFNIHLLYDTMLNYKVVYDTNSDTLKSVSDSLYNVFFIIGLPLLSFMIPIVFITATKYPLDKEFDRHQKVNCIWLPATLLLTPIIFLIVGIVMFLLGLILALPGWIILCGLGSMKWKEVTAFWDNVIWFFAAGIPITTIYFLLFFSLNKFIKKIDKEQYFLKQVSYWASAIIGLSVFVLPLILFNNNVHSSVNVINTKETESLIAQKDSVSSRYRNNTDGHVTVNAANARSGPSTKHPIVTLLKKGDQFKVLSSSNGWSRIRFNETEGYIVNELIQTSKNENYYIFRFTIRRNDSAGASIKEIKSIPGATQVTLYAQKGTLHTPNHKYGMYLLDKETGKKYRLLSASIPYEKRIKNTTFTLTFEEIPKNTKHIDLIEGKCTERCWTFTDIQL